MMDTARELIRELCSDSSKLTDQPTVSRLHNSLGELSADEQSQLTVDFLQSSANPTTRNIIALTQVLLSASAGRSFNADTVTPLLDLITPAIYSSEEKHLARDAVLLLASQYGAILRAMLRQPDRFKMEWKRLSTLKTNILQTVIPIQVVDLTASSAKKQAAAAEPKVPTKIGVKLAALKLLQSVIQEQSAIPNDLLIEEGRQLYRMAYDMINGKIRKGQLPAAVATAFVNIFGPIVVAQPSQFLLPTLELLFTVSEISESTPRLAYLSKSIKTALVFLTKNCENIPADLAARIMDLLTDRFDARQDLLVLQQQLQLRGIQYFIRRTAAITRKLAAAPAAAADLEKMLTPPHSFTAQQQAMAVVSALLQHGSSAAGTPHSTPPGFQLQQTDPRLLADLLIRSLQLVGANRSDGGIADWQKTVGLLKAGTAESLQMQIDSEAAASDVIEELEAYILHSAASQLQLDAQAEPEMQREQRQKLYEQIVFLFDRILRHSPIGWRENSGDDEADDDEDGDGEDRNDSSNLETTADATNTTDSLITALDQQNRKHQLSGDPLQLLATGGAQWLYDISVQHGKRRSGDWPKTAELIVSSPSPVKRRRLENNSVAEETAEQADNSDSTDSAMEKVTEQPEKNKDNDDDDEESGVSMQFKGSRAYWCVLLSRLACSLVDRHTFYPDSSEGDSAEQQQERRDFHGLCRMLKLQNIIPFTLAHFKQRWDFALRWLWEEWYREERALEFSSSPDANKQYDYWVCRLVGSMINLADEAAAVAFRNPTVFVPWLQRDSESALFRRFLLMLPRLSIRYLFGEELDGGGETQFAISSAATPPPAPPFGCDEEPAQCSLLLSLADTEFNQPLPTPLQQLRAGLAFDILYDLATYRPAMRSQAFQLLCRYFVHHEKRRRAEALRVAKRWWSSEDSQSATAAKPTSGETDESAGFVDGIHLLLTEKCTNFAIKSLDQLRNAEPTEGSNGNEWTEDQVLCLLDLFLILFVRNPTLVSHLFQVFSGAASEYVGLVLLATVGKVVPLISMPLSAEDLSVSLGSGSAKTTESLIHSSGNRLLRGIPSPLTRGSEQVFRRILQSWIAPSTQAESTGDSLISSWLNQRPSIKLTRFVMDRVHSEPSLTNDPQFWSLVLPGRGMTRNDIMRGLIILCDSWLGVANVSEMDERENEMNRDRLRRQFAQTVDRLLTTHARTEQPGAENTFHPVDLFVLLHIMDSKTFMDPLKLPTVSLKKTMEATHLLLAYPTIAKHFNQRQISIGITTILERYGHKVPTLLMRTVMNVAKKYKQESFGFLVEKVLLKCVHFKSLLLGQKLDSPQLSAALPANIDDETKRRARALWEGWCRAINETKPESFRLIVKLPKGQLTQLLTKLGMDLQQEFGQWLKRYSSKQQSYVTAAAIVQSLTGGQQKTSTSK